MECSLLLPTYVPSQVPFPPPPPYKCDTIQGYRMGGEKGKKERYRPMQGINFASCLCLSFPCFLYLRKCGKGEYLFYASLVSWQQKEKKMPSSLYILAEKRIAECSAEFAAYKCVAISQILEDGGRREFHFFPALLIPLRPRLSLIFSPLSQQTWRKQGSEASKKREYIKLHLNIVERYMRGSKRGARGKTGYRTLAWDLAYAAISRFQVQQCQITFFPRPQKSEEKYPCSDTQQ